MPAARRARLDESGVRVEEHSLYRIDAAASVVHAQIDVTITNEAPGSSGFNYTSYSYVPRAVVPVLSEAANLVATTSDGGPLDVTVEALENPNVSLAKIDLDPYLYYGDTGTVRLTYDLPNQPPRSDRLTRVNAGFAVVLPLLFADPGLDSVEIDAPPGFDGSIEGTATQFVESHITEGGVWKADNISADKGWYAVFVARHDDFLITRHVDVAGESVDVRAWPGDQQWEDLVERTVQKGLPALEQLIGQPVPHDQPLVITESITPNVYGAEGWYDAANNTIEIGEDPDEHTILHELSHLWFNRDVLTGRWMSEAFAEEYASRALERLGQPLSAPQPADPADASAIRLNSWSGPGGPTAGTAGQDLFVYRAAWTILRTVTQEIGMEKLAAVVKAITDHTIAYRGDPEPERWSGVTDWQRMLDLLEDVGGSTSAETVMAQLALTDEQRGDLTQRAAARQSYTALRDAGQGWSVPLAVRQLMGEWEFDAAAAQMVRANAILASKAQLQAVLEPVGLRVPEGLERAYETTPGDLAPLQDDAERYVTAANDLVAARNAIRRSHSTLERIGLVGSDLMGDWRAAADRLDHGDVAGAESSVHDIVDDLRRSQREGHRRVAGLLAAALLLVPLALGRRALRVVERDRHLTTVSRIASSAGSGVRAAVGLAARAPRAAVRRLRRRSG